MFHVYARGNRKADISRDDVDCRTYVGLLGAVVTRMRWTCLAYCLMPNHVHLLLTTPEPNLGRGMQRLHGRYAETFNARHGEVGHVFQGRYGAVAVTDDAQLLTTVGYIAANPVSAGLVADPAAWRWSSHRAISGLEVAPPWLAAGTLLELLSAFGGSGGERYRELVAGRVPPAGVTDSLSETTTTGAGSGSAVR
ncbi:MAG: toxin RelE [Conexibacter sp.]|nr:toxin RelE [Conexibacter sp.]